jgi:hypothetical protein
MKCNVIQDHVVRLILINVKRSYDNRPPFELLWNVRMLNDCKKIILGFFISYGH